MEHSLLLRPSEGKLLNPILLALALHCCLLILLVLVISPLKDKKSPPQTYLLESLELKTAGMQDGSRLGVLTSRPLGSWRKKPSILSAHKTRTNSINRFQKSLNFSRSFPLPSHDLGSLQNSLLEISFPTPQGVDVSELNRLEQIFYSFHLRVHRTYAQSLMMTAHHYLNQNPHATIDFKKLYPETLRAKVRFHAWGKIKTVSILRESRNDHLQNIFFQALKGIKSIPNPPRAFVQDRDDFTLYFNLVIKNR